MCGRFVQKTPLGEIRVLFGASNPVPNAPPRYNAAPTDTLAVVRYNPKTRERSLDLLRWGLVPLWAKDISFGVRCINGRAETLSRTPAFCDAFERRRCLVPADAFYEWQKMGGKTQPYAIVPAMAVSLRLPVCGSAGATLRTAAFCAALRSSPARRMSCAGRSTTACR